MAPFIQKKIENSAGTKEVSPVSEIPNNFSSVQFEDNRPSVVSQRKLQEAMNNDPRLLQLATIQSFANQYNTKKHLNVTSDYAQANIAEDESKLNSDKTSIQRKVGFEFQSRKLNVLDNKKNQQTYSPDKGRSKAFLDKGSWYLTSDGGDPEFVVDPPLEESDQNGLARVMTQITRTANGLGKRDMRYHTTGKKVDVTITGNEDPVTADPQATIGVGYRRIGTLIDQLADRDPMGGGQSNANRNLMQNTAVRHYRGDDLMLGKVKAFISDIVNNEYFPDTIGPRQLVFDATFPTLVNHKDEAIGVLTMVGSYIRKAMELGHAYIKDFPILAKTDMGTIVANSVFGGVKMDSDKMWWIINAVTNGRKNINEQMYDKRKIGSPKPAEDGPTIKEWLESLFERHRDLLSYRINRAFADNSMGNLKKMDKVGPNQNDDAPILELRRMVNDVPVNQWATLAEQIRAWVHRLNDTTQNPNDL